VKCLQFFLLSILEPLANDDEGRHDRTAWTKFLRNPGPEVRRGYALRRLVARVPVVLMPRVQDLPQVRDDVRSNQRSAIKHFPDLFQAFG
jgi:hypothetical protein